MLSVISPHLLPIQSKRWALEGWWVSHGGPGAEFIGRTLQSLS